MEKESKNQKKYKKINYASSNNVVSSKPQKPVAWLVAL